MIHTSPEHRKGSYAAVLRCKGEKHDTCSLSTSPSSSSSCSCGYRRIHLDGRHHTIVQSHPNHFEQNIRTCPKGISILLAVLALSSLICASQFWSLQRCTIPRNQGAVREPMVELLYLLHAKESLNSVLRQVHKCITPLMLFLLQKQLRLRR